MITHKNFNRGGNFLSQQLFPYSNTFVKCIPKAEAVFPPPLPIRVLLEKDTQFQLETAGGRKVSAVTTRHQTQHTNFLPLRMPWGLGNFHQKSEWQITSELPPRNTGSFSSSLSLFANEINLVLVTPGRKALTSEFGQPRLASALGRLGHQTSKRRLGQPPFTLPFHCSFDFFPFRRILWFY